MFVLARTSTLHPLALLDAVRSVAEASGDPAPELVFTLEKLGVRWVRRRTPGVP